VPGFKRIRATEVLRLPVAVMMNEGQANGEDLRLLRSVGMLGAGVHAKLREHLTSEVVLRKHAAHGRAHDAIGVGRREQLVGRDRLDTAHVARVVGVDLLLALAAGQDDLLGVHDDDVVAGVGVGREGRLVLPAQNGRHARRQPAEDQVLRVDDVPAAFDLVGGDATGRRKSSLRHLE